jgi:hypothetical protein
VETISNPLNSEDKREVLVTCDPSKGNPSRQVLLAEPGTSKLREPRQKAPADWPGVKELLDGGNYNCGVSTDDPF